MCYVILNSAAQVYKCEMPEDKLTLGVRNQSKASDVASFTAFTFPKIY